MTPNVRRQLALIVVGGIAAIVALITATWLRQDACLDAGGQWVVTTETCNLAGAVMPRGAVIKPYVYGAGIGLLAGTMLWRMFSFFADRQR